MALVLFFTSGVKEAFQRLGIDGIIGFGWKLLVPAAAPNVAIMAIFIIKG